MTFVFYTATSVFVPCTELYKGRSSCSLYLATATELTKLITAVA